MIEAIPLNSDCIVLIITKVEDPEELDTRFSKFAPSVRDDDSLDDMDSGFEMKAQTMFSDLFKRIHEGRVNGGQNGQKTLRQEEKAEEAGTAEGSVSLTRIYSL